MSGEELKKLGKRVSKLEGIGMDTFIGPGPEGNDKKAMKEQAVKDAEELGKGIEKFRRKNK